MRAILTLSNLLSFARIPLAFCFLSQSVELRLTSVTLAMVTDSIDGFIARKTKTISRFGTLLDPLADKFFALFALVTLTCEHKLEVWEALAMLSRDGALALFALYLVQAKKWSSYQFRAFRWGKVATALQFLVFIALILGIAIPQAFYGAFGGLGGLALFELVRGHKESASA